MKRRDEPRGSKDTQESRKQFSNQPHARTLPSVLGRGSTGAGLLGELDSEALSILASEIAWNTPCDSKAEKLVLCYLAHRANVENAEAWPKASTIAEATCLSTASVERAVKTLASKGHITIRRTGRENHYLFTWPDLKQCQNRPAPIHHSDRPDPTNFSPPNSMGKGTEKGEGKTPQIPDSKKLSTSERITLERIDAQLSKRLDELQGDLISNRLTEERKQKRAQLSTVRAALMADALAIAERVMPCPSAS